MVVSMREEEPRCSRVGGWRGVHQSFGTSTHLLSWFCSSFVVTLLSSNELTFKPPSTLSSREHVFFIYLFVQATPQSFLHGKRQQRLTFICLEFVFGVYTVERIQHSMQDMAGGDDIYHFKSFIQNLIHTSFKMGPHGTSRRKNMTSRITPILPTRCPC